MKEQSNKSKDGKRERRIRKGMRHRRGGLGLWNALSTIACYCRGSRMNFPNPGGASAGGSA